jgi:hypothetical protein
MAAGMQRDKVMAADGRQPPAGGAGSRGRECTACRGVGMLLCKRCGGSGYSKR